MLTLLKLFFKKYNNRKRLKKWYRSQLLKYNYLEPIEVRMELFIETKSNIGYGIGAISFKIGEI